MLNEPFNLLSTMRMKGVARARKEQVATEDYAGLSFEERIGMLVDREWAAVGRAQLTRRLQHARLRERACLEGIVTGTSAGWTRHAALVLRSVSPSAAPAARLSVARADDFYAELLARIARTDLRPVAEGGPGGRSLGTGA